MTPGELVRRLPLLPLVLGISDGILNALTLAAGAILRGSGRGLDAGLALRVGVASLVTASFTMFVADYSERRSRLLRSARELNLTRPGRLAATVLGRAVAREAAVATTVAGVASLLGAVAPLMLGTVLPAPSWLTLVIAVACLGGLGWVIGSVMAGRPWLWAVVLFIGGAVVAAIGAALDIA